MNRDVLNTYAPKYLDVSTNSISLTQLFFFVAFFITCATVFFPYSATVSFLFCFSFVFLFAYNITFLIAYAQDTLGTTLHITRLIVLLPLLLPEQEVDGTPFTTMDTNIFNLKCPIGRIIASLRCCNLHFGRYRSR